VEYYKYLADVKDNKKIQYKLALYYFEGIIVPKDYKKAIKYFTNNSIFNDSLYYIGECIFNGGFGISQNIPLSIEYFTKSTEKGNFRLGYCYFYGIGVSKNYDIAFQYFKKSSMNGYKPASNYLGKCYEYGKGVVRNIVTATDYYKNAS